ncbi:GntR family transcriptional regulator [Streptomyces sp. NPDC096311]|uniref:GntR family transcriptional regulator n=1 Tax=Streptomyces sp. NPDC096311 TaxID=3366083 RepID=UPI00380D987E
MSGHRANKAAEIASMLEKAIVGGDLAPGTVLRQDQLSTELGVSRTPIREALQQVAALGLVTIEPNRGARVRMPTREEVTERWLIRSELEALAGELAVERITRTQLKDLRATARQVAKLTEQIAASQSDRELQWLDSEWNAANMAFHDLILEAAGAPLLARTVRSMYNVVRSPLMWTPDSRLTELARKADEQHKAIVEAFASKDPDVRDLLRRHIRDSLDFVTESLFDSSRHQPRLLPPNLAQLSAR